MEEIGNQAGKSFDFPAQFFTNTISIAGIITDDLADKVIAELDFLANFHKTIIIFIESPGGNFFAAKRIYDKLLNISGNIKTIGIARGDLSSISSVIFQGFLLRIISENTEMLMHNIKEEITLGFIPFVHSRKKTHEVIDGMIDEAYAIQRFINDSLIIVSGKSEKIITNLLLKKPILNASQILEYELADQILNSEQILEFCLREEVYGP
jgi:ATP-dependent protease ClpP protease subunit